MSNAELIAECGRVEDLAERAHAAWALLQQAEEQYRSLCPARPLIPDSTKKDCESVKALRASVAVFAASDSAHAVDMLPYQQGRLARMEAYELECDAAFRACRVEAAIAVAERWNERLVEATRDLALLPARTRVGLEAKARTWLKLRSLAPRDLSFEWGDELAERVILETVHLAVWA